MCHVNLAYLTSLTDHKPLDSKVVIPDMLTLHTQPHSLTTSLCTKGGHSKYITLHT